MKLMKRILSMVMVCAMTFSLCSAPAAYAASSSSASATAASEENLSTKAVSTASTERTILNYLVSDMGLNRAAAAGVISNIWAETSMRYDIGMEDTNGKYSYGICMWNGPRYTHLRNWCSSKGYNYRTLNAQLRFLEYELKTGYPGVYNYIKKVPNTAKGAYNAAYYWCYHFEKPAKTKERSIERGKQAQATYWPRCRDAALDGTAEANPVPILKNASHPASSMACGSYFPLKGTISCGVSISKVTAAVTTSTGKTATSASSSPKAKSYDVGKLDDKVKFSKLAPGSYTYSITAVVSGKTYTLLSDKFTVNSASLSKASVKLVSSCVYTGKPLTPAPTVTIGSSTLLQGRDYKLEYSSNTKIGQATVKIVGIGGYSGSVKKTFLINPSPVTQQILSSKVAKTATVSWKPHSNCQGYRIEYTTDKSFGSYSKAVVWRNSAKTTTLNGLKRGKTYYIRVKTFQYVENRKAYNYSTSKISAVKIK